MSDTKWVTGYKILNNYVIEDVLGVGGASTVYLVRRLTDSTQFALKAIYIDKLDSTSNHQLLFNELRTWIDLPEHPNITTCRFFKTIERNIGIFADYVDGGSLKDWIQSRKLTRLDEIIDVAIQCAYAFQLAHDHGVIHQDVKPGNVLMTRDGIPRITDFGLARLTSGKLSGNGSESHLDTNHSSTRGFTMAYCSPEQFQQTELTASTDIWSFGVMFAQMLTGELLTKIGYLADEAFHYDFENQPGAPYQTVPDSIVQILDKCIQREPQDRWQSFNELNAKLHQVFYLEFGREYHRSKPEIITVQKLAKTSHDRKTENGLIWDDPLDWLEKAFTHANRDLSEMDMMIPEQTGSRTSQALRDLEIYEIALKIYRSQSEIDSRMPAEDLVPILLSKALVHEGVSDWKGSINTRDQAIKILEDCVYNDSKSDLTGSLSIALMQQGWILCRIGEIKPCMDCYEKARVLREFMFKNDQTPELAVELSKSYAGIGEALSKQKRFREGQINFDKAVDLLYQVVFEQEKHEYAHMLAVYYQTRAFLLKRYVEPSETLEYLDKAMDIMENRVNFDTDEFDIYIISDFSLKRAIITREFEKYDDALYHLNRAIKILENAVYQENRNELSPDLAEAYHHKSKTLNGMKNYRDAGLFIDEAITILDRLVNIESREDLAESLSDTYEEKAQLLIDNGDKWAAIKFLTKATELLKWLIYTDGQTELRENLARVCLKQAELYTAQKDYHSVVHIYEPVVQIYKSLVYEDSRKEYREPLARTQCEMAYALMQIGNISSAKSLVRDGMKLLDSLVERTKIQDLKAYHKKMKQLLKRLL